MKYWRVNNEMCGHEKFRDIFYRIVDLTDIDKNELSLKDIKAFVAHDLSLSQTNPRLKFAIVTDDETLQGMVAFYEFEGHEIPWEIELFPTLEDAREWLASYMSEI